jgi:hypothetical protein
VLLLLLAAALGSPQDPPKVTYEDSGEFRLLALDLERRFKGRLRFFDKIPKKDVSISVRDAGYFQALDALCRAHGEVTYFPRGMDGGTGERLKLFSQPWVEYPASYDGHFKIALISMMRTVRSTAAGDQADVQSDVVLFGPPWISVTQHSGSRMDWKIEEALSKDGRDVRAPIQQDAGPVEVWLEGGNPTQGNYESEVLSFLDFKTTEGLKSLKGVVKLTYAESRLVRISVKEGSAVRLPQGRLVVESVGKIEDDWRIVVSFKPDAAKNAPYLPAVLEQSAFYEGGPELGLQLNFPWRQRTIDIRIGDLAVLPSWIDFRARMTEHVVDIPFRFTNVAFRKE